MTSVLRDLQAQYDERARMALEPRGNVLEPIAKPKATRTYTGAALARRRAWGLTWGSILKAHAHELRQGANRSV